MSGTLDRLPGAIANPMLRTWWYDMLRARDVDLRVLALWQPWAQLVVAPDPARDGKPAKGNETRHFKPKTRTTELALPIACAVFATKTMSRDIRETFGREMFATTLRRLGYWPGDPKRLYQTSDECPSTPQYFIKGEGEYTTLKPLPLGHLVGLCEIASIATSDDERARLHAIASDDEYATTAERDVARRELAFGYYAPGRYAWTLRRAMPLVEPIAMTGKQDVLYRLDAALVDLITRQLTR